MQLICVVGNGLNSCGPLKRLLSCQNHSPPLDVGVSKSSLHLITHWLVDPTVKHPQLRCSKADGHDSQQRVKSGIQESGRTRPNPGHSTRGMNCRKAACRPTEGIQCI